MEDHPVELTYEEMSSMTNEQIKEFRDKSLKQLEKSLAEVARKKKEEHLKLVDAIDTIAGTVVAIHSRLENLERVIKQLIRNEGYEIEFEETIDKKKLN